jgi:phage shock protein PspC (stress-responsive transcriptional regulator)
MKKVITIHINGVLFHMEEDAFATMRESLFRQGKQGDKATEVLLAERFGALLTPGKQVITLNDVQTVLPQLGFRLIYETNYNDSTETGTKRIYRNANDKVIGGVCSGFGEYWNIDPLILRILFIVLFFGFGVGLLFYILLWILLPVKK